MPAHLRIRQATSSPLSTSLPTSTATPTSSTHASATTSTSTSSPTATNSSQQGSNWSKSKGGIIAAVVILFLLFLAFGSIFLLRRLRENHSNPKYVPGKWLKGKWEAWTPSNVRKRYSSSLADRRSIQEARRSPSPAAMHMLRSTGTDLSGTDSSTNGVSREVAADRHTSVRSIMTLPPYSVDAGETEQIIGREGDRGGIDTVLEFPENPEEEESRREEEMESLYQIRVARRRERAEREERRRLRREARSRADMNTVEELRRQDRNAASTPSLPGELNSVAAIQEHYARERGRRVSSVSYADLGVASHDGSRVRADSNDSDRPLLSSANPMGSRRPSDPRVRMTHHHNQSTSSLRFATTDISDDERTSLENDAASFVSQRPSLAGTAPDGSSLRLQTTQDSGDQHPPMPHLPSYEDIHQESRLSVIRGAAPPYESPVEPQPTGQQSLNSLPEIEITPFTPILNNPEEEEHEAE